MSSSPLVFASSTLIKKGWPHGVAYAGSSGTGTGGGGGGGGGGTPAVFPSRLHIASHQLQDSNQYNLGALKGFGVDVGASAQQIGMVWSQADYTAMSAAGATVVRHAIYWDTFEPSSGSISSLALTALDTAIARAKAAGMYTILACPRLNVGRVPLWAQTAGQNEWQSLTVSGHNLIATIAARYATELAVIGLNPSAPPASDLGQLMTGYQTIVPWYRDITGCTSWPVILNGCRQGEGTPYPTGAGLTQLSPTTYASLDTHNNGVLVEWHDYLNAAGGYSTSSYQPDGTVAAIQNVGSTGAQFHGYSGNYTYPNTAQSRTDTSNHLADVATFTRQNSRFALAVGAFGIDNAGGEAAFGADKGNSYNTAGAVVQVWGSYDTAPVAQPTVYWGGTIRGDCYGGTNAGYGTPPFSGTSNDNTWNLFEQRAGKAVTCQSTFESFLTWSSDPFDHSRSRGAFCLCSTALGGSFTIAGVNAGTYDSQIDTWARTVAAYGQPIMFRPWWEMNGNWGYAWQTGAGVTAAQYVSAWQRFRSRCDAQGANNLTWLWCPNVWNSPSGVPGSGISDPTPWYPGDGYVDWFGLDGYNKAASSYSFDQIFQASYAGLQAMNPNKPMSIPEIASEEYSGGTSIRANWIRDMLHRIPRYYPAIKLLVWYNDNNGSVTDGSGAGDTFPIEASSTTPGVYTGTSPASTAFANGIGSGYYAANIVTATTFPNGTKVPSP